MLLISLVIRPTRVGIMSVSSLVAQTVLREGTRLIVKRLLRSNRRALFCPNCKQRVILPRKKKVRRRMNNG